MHGITTNLARQLPRKIRSSRRRWRGQPGLAGDDDGSVFSCCGQQSDVAGIAGQDAISWYGQQNDGRIDRIRAAGQSLEDACVAAVALADRAHIGSPQQPGQVRLAAMPVAPHLSDDHRVGPQLQSVLLGSPEPGDHRAVVMVDCH
jgi:hypothetical protein